MPHLKELSITNDYLAIFARGRSSTMMRREEAEEIRSKCFTFGINNFSLIAPHVLVWMDKDLMTVDRKGWPKVSLWATRPIAIYDEIEHLIDYTFDPHEKGLLGNCTVYTLMQLLHRDFPSKKCLLFGLDFDEADPCNFITDQEGNVIDDDRRKEDFYKEHYLPVLRNDIHRHAKRDDTFRDYFINCSPASKLECFARKDWREVLQ